ncbi:MAG: cytochrome c [Granulosicoccaceae bacterium]|jgi:sulfide dehydrogenase cytochrome subunit
MRFSVLTSPLVFTIVLAGMTSAQAAGVSRGAMLSNSCAACHGTDGNSPGAIPSIHGKSADFISQSLKEFRAGERPSTVMGRHATGYSDEEIDLIANFFAGQSEQ